MQFVGKLRHHLQLQKNISDIYTVTDAILFKSLPPAEDGVISNESLILKKKVIEQGWPKVSGCYTPIPKEENFYNIIGYSELKNQFDDNLIFTYLHVPI